MAVKVAKFGGTSMATAESIIQVANIIKADKERKFVIVSAPGKRNSQDRKITDMLYACYHEIEMINQCKDTFDMIRERYVEIANDLKLSIDINNILDRVYTDMIYNRSADFCASRGEYLSAIIMSAFMNVQMIDAKDIICFGKDNILLEDITNDNTKDKLKNVECAIIPGFYGSDKDKNIHTFSRGGSDVTGAIIARAVGASVYENWTDVNGFMTCDPRIVNNPKPIPSLSYGELRELAYMGANVLHPESIFPVKHSNIPINIKNTFDPENKGTFILPETKHTESDRVITGIAGKKGYSIVFIEKSMMNSEIGFARRVLSVFEYYGISFEHMPSGIDTLSVVVADSEIVGKEEVLMDRITKTVMPDNIEITSGLSLIATVGNGMCRKMGTAGRLFKALADAGVNIRMIDQGSSEMNIIVGVLTENYEKSINAIYYEFVK